MLFVWSITQTTTNVYLTVETHFVSQGWILLYKSKFTLFTNVTTFERYMEVIKTSFSQKYLDCLNIRSENLLAEKL